MSSDPHNYYLQQLDIPIWVERNVVKLEPSLSHLPNDAKMLYVLNLHDDFTETLKHFLEQVAFAIHEHETVIAYAYYNLFDTQQPDISQLEDYINTGDRQVIIIEQQALLCTMLASQHKLSACIIDANEHWNSAKSKKQLMTKLLQNRYIIQ